MLGVEVQVSMSELIDNASRNKELLRHLLLQVHQGDPPEAVRHQLERILGEVPYEMVVEVEQELLAEGLPAEEILKFCDIHTQVLKGNIRHSEPVPLPPGHPVETFREENRALQWEIDQCRRLAKKLTGDGGDESGDPGFDQLRLRFYALTDVEKHYARKENLLFPYLENHGVKGPSTVMWAKDDEARARVQAGVEVFETTSTATREEIQGLVELIVEPALESLEDMIYREEQVLLPLALESLTEEEWLAIARQSPEIGFCLYDPPVDWVPESGLDRQPAQSDSDRIQLPSGSLNRDQLLAILNTIPFDVTFVDADDRVRYFSQGRERIFTRTRAIVGRKVQLCHPPGSVHIVQQILDDFRSGRQDRAPFWIEMKGKFIHIEYFALRDPEGNYLGTLEVSQDLTAKRALSGEQRLLTYVPGDSK